MNSNSPTSSIQPSKQPKDDTELKPPVLPFSNRSLSSNDYSIPPYHDAHLWNPLASTAHLSNPFASGMAGASPYTMPLGMGADSLMAMSLQLYYHQCQKEFEKWLRTSETARRMLQSQNLQQQSSEPQNSESGTVKDINSDKISNKPLVDATASLKGKQSQNSLSSQQTDEVSPAASLEKETNAIAANYNEQKNEVKKLNSMQTGSDLVEPLNVSDFECVSIEALIMPDEEVSENKDKGGISKSDSSLFKAGIRRKKIKKE